MASCGRAVAVAAAAALLLLLAAQVLAQGDGSLSPTAGSDPHPGTTRPMGFLMRIFQGAKGLMWQDPAQAAATTATGPETLPGPTAAHTEAHVLPLKAAQLQEVSSLNFSLTILDEDLKGPAEPREYVEGAAIRLEASVRAGPGLFPKLFIDECYGSGSDRQSHARHVYVIVDNHGCLYGGDSAASWFRREDSAIVLTVPAFLLTGDLDEVYIHCRLTAWSQKLPTSPGKKGCQLDSIASRWRNVDDPSRTSVCHCCDSHCPAEPPPLGALKAFSGEGRSHSKVVGPLRVRKADVPWFEGRCRTMKTLLLVSVSFVSSCVLAALFVGTLVALILGFLRYSQARRGHQLLKSRKEQPYHTELQTVVGALAVAEDEEKESSIDYCKLKSDTPEKP